MLPGAAIVVRTGGRTTGGGGLAAAPSRPVRVVPPASSSSGGLPEVEPLPASPSPLTPTRLLRRGPDGNPGQMKDSGAVRPWHTPGVIRVRQPYGSTAA